MIYTEEQTLLRYNLEQQEYRLPGSVKYIGNGAFQNNNDLVRLILHDNVSTIGDYAMRNCRALSQVTLPSAVMSFGVGVFTNCGELRTVRLPSGVIAIDHLTFRGCRQLGEIDIPDTVQGISPRAFETCGRLSSIIIPPGKIDLLNEKYALIAVRTFMHIHPTGCNKYINAFVKTHPEAVIEDCLDRGDRNALSYMIRNELFTAASVSKAIELSRQQELTDICAMLLSYQNGHSLASDASFIFRDL